MVQLQEICSAASIDGNSDNYQAKQAEPQASSKSIPDSPHRRKLSQLDDSLSTTSSQQTIVNRVHFRQLSQKQQAEHERPTHHQKKDSASGTQSLEEECSEATTIIPADPQVNFEVYNQTTRL